MLYGSMHRKYPEQEKLPDRQVSGRLRLEEWGKWRVTVNGYGGVILKLIGVIVTQFSIFVFMLEIF